MASNDCLTCFNVYDNGEHRIRMLPCGHSQCTRCIQAQFINGLITCASCRITHTYNDVNAIPVNYTAEKMKEEIDKLKKQITLPEENYATHLTPKIHEGICEEHAAYKLFWCNIHHKWICTHCSVTDHPRGDCDIIPIKTMLQNNRALIKSKISKELKQLDTTENELKLSIDDVEKQTTQIKNEIEKLKKLVSEKEKDIAVLNARHPKLITLGQECKDKKTILNNLITDLLAATTFKELDNENKKCDSIINSYENWRKKLDEDKEISLNTLPTMLEKLMMETNTQEKMKMIEETKKMLHQRIQGSQMYGTKKIGNNEYYALIEHSQGLIFINDLQKNITPGANAIVLKYENIMPLLPSSPVVFITLSYHGATLGQLHIKLDGRPSCVQQFMELVTGSSGQGSYRAARKVLSGKLRGARRGDGPSGSVFVLSRVQQFMELVTGSSGRGSYRAASFDRGVEWKGQPREHVYCSKYTTAAGGMESSALYTVEDTGTAPSTEGLVFAWKRQGAGFGILTRAHNDTWYDTVLGHVTTGLPELKAAIEKYDIKDIVFSNCGVVLNASA